MNNDVFLKIAEWKREAANEFGGYFYKTSMVNRILNGSRYLVIGRKGSGKTAICRHIHSIKSPNRYSAEVSFKDFPLKETFRHADNNFNPENSMTAFWQYAIYMELMRLMSQNPNIAHDGKEQLRTLFGKDYSVVSLTDHIEQIFSPKFSLEGFGFKLGAEFSAEQQNSGSKLSLQNKIRIAEKFIERYLDASKYYLQFDYLDDEYVNILASEDGRYVDLVRGLLRAVSKVRDFSNQIQRNVLPVVYLRDDIFNRIDDNNTAKWYDGMIEITWDEESIKKMLAHRISVDLGSKHLFEDAWGKIVSDEMIAVGRNNDMVTTFSYLKRRTHMRPRDFIEYIRLCADHVADHDDKVIISPNTWKEVETTYSNRLKREIQDELWGPCQGGVRKLMECFQAMKKKRFNLVDFNRVFEERKLDEEGFISVEKCLELLYSVNLIAGKVRRVNETRSEFLFKYQNPTAENLNIRETMQIHPGLYKAFAL